MVSTPAIGAATDALRIYSDMVRDKASGDVTKLAQDVSTQVRIAEARNSLEEMQSVMLCNFDAMMAVVREDGTFTVRDRVLYRYQASLSSFREGVNYGPPYSWTEHRQCRGFLNC